MLRKKFLAIAAAGTMALGLAAGASTADAKHRHNHFRHHNNGVGIFLGAPFFFDGFHGNRHSYRNGYYGDYDCRWVKVKRKHHKARLVKRCHYDNW